MYFTWLQTNFFHRHHRDEMTKLTSPHADGKKKPWTECDIYVGDLHPSLSLRSSTSSEDDMPESEEDILVSMDGLDDPTEEESHGDEVEEHKPSPAFGKALDGRVQLQAVVYVIRVQFGKCASVQTQKRPRLHAYMSVKTSYI